MRVRTGVRTTESELKASRMVLEKPAGERESRVSESGRQQVESRVGRDTWNLD